MREGRVASDNMRHSLVRMLPTDGGEPGAMRRAPRPTMEPVVTRAPASRIPFAIARLIAAELGKAWLRRASVFRL